MATLNDYVDVRKILNDLILKHYCTIVMIRDHTGIPSDHIYQIIAHNKQATNREVYEIVALMRDVLNFENNKKSLIDYLTSEKVIKKKENSAKEVIDMLDFGGSEYGHQEVVIN